MSDLDATHPPRHDIGRLLEEYDRALAYTDSLWSDLTDDDLRWRPHENFSPIAWHLGHQAAVSHFMVRNLTAAEPLLDPELDRLMDSATAEADRGDMPDGERLRSYRDRAAERLRVRMNDIDAGRVGAPRQLRHIAAGLLIAVINHEYQHSTWIAEVRSDHLGRSLPDRPGSDLLIELDGYPLVV
jgi:hypothetical protein